MLAAGNDFADTAPDGRDEGPGARRTCSAGGGSWVMPSRANTRPARGYQACLLVSGEQDGTGCVGSENKGWSSGRKGGC